MQREQILALLIEERDRLNRAIEALSGPVKRRGRPPKTPVQSGGETVTGPKRRSLSATTRAKMAAAQKKRWAAKKAAK